MTPEQLRALTPVPLARTSLLGRVPARRRRKAALKPLREPRAEELRYTAVLRHVVAGAVALVRERLLPALPALVAQAGRATARGDGGRLDDASDTLAQILESIYLALGLSEEEARRRAAEMLTRVGRYHAEQFVRLYEGTLAVNPLAGAEPWLRDQMALAVKENARLITSLPEKLLADIEGVVNRGVLAGMRHEELAKLIVARCDVADSRATLIARDQVLKWHGSLTRLRHQDAGVSEYTWSTSQDERVRPSHRVRNGKRYKWDAFPIPGQEVLCRCAAIPVLDESEE